jgi:hypothetical protein
LPLDSIFDEATRVLDEAKKRDITLKLFGGMAIYTRCESAKKPPLARNYVDIDVMGRSKQSRSIRDMFLALGYVPRQKFNAMYGDRRLVFNDADHNRRVDVFLDWFEMCHKFDMKERLKVDGTTIPPADMLLTKLQIVEINEKDLKDLTCILMDHEIGSTDDHQINGPYIAELCANDWGIYRTVTGNLDRLSTFVPGILGGDGEVVGTRIKTLKAMIEEAPKSLRWKVRARVGERAAWYILPEADKEIIDSRMPEGLTQGQAPSKL